MHCSMIRVLSAAIVWSDWFQASGWAPELDRLNGELLFKVGDSDEAERFLRRALEAAHAQGARLLEFASGDELRGSSKLDAGAGRARDYLRRSTSNLTRVLRSLISRMPRLG